MSRIRPDNIPANIDNAGMVDDVTALRDSELRYDETEALTASVARMRAAFETSYLYQGLLRPDGILIDANPTSLAGIEASLEDVVGKSFWDTPWFTGTPSVQAELAAVFPKVARGESIRTEFSLNLPIGRRAFDFSMRPVFDAAGKVIAIVPEAIDLTEHRSAEAQLRQSQKVESIGRLTGGLAHDFNNLLTGICGNLDLLHSRVAKGRLDDLDRYIESAQSAARRAAALTHRLLAFSRRQSPEPKSTDAHRLVVGMEELIRRTVSPTIEVEVLTERQLWRTLTDQHQLESALLNLCINARDAMPQGGRLTIATANVWLDEVAAGKCGLSAGPYVCLSVRDSGCGMSPEIIARAFDPFFTTKPAGEGTGLGLATVYAFARQCGGQACIQSEPGSGTTVSLYLPRHDAEDDSTERPTETAALPRAGRGETVLVVDDEPAVRMLIADVLDELGYTAIEADDGRSGLQILRSERRIDLLVTDLGLPGGIDGHQLAAAGRELRPNLKVLFVTGYGPTAMLGGRALTADMHVLSKPFALDTLAGRIKDIIEGR